MSTPAIVPFRWDLRRRETLGRLAIGDSASSYECFTDDLRACCARVVAFAGDADLVFVGRSPESLFDYLSGALLETTWADRLTLVQVSLRFLDPDALLGRDPETIGRLRAYFEVIGLEPEAIIARPRPLALIDVVASGSTFFALTMILKTWCAERRLDWPALHRKLRYVGLTMEDKPSPKAWRWRQRADWTASVPEATFKDVSAPARLWLYLGNFQEKTTPSHHQNIWGDPRSARPSREDWNLRALRLALSIFEAACTRAERERFVTALHGQREVRERWFRDLAGEIRRS